MATMMNTEPKLEPCQSISEIPRRSPQSILQYWRTKLAESRFSEESCRKHGMEDLSKWHEGKADAIDQFADELEHLILPLIPDTRARPQSSQVEWKPKTRENFCEKLYLEADTREDIFAIIDSIYAQAQSEKPWTEDDPRMWKEQCRIGDVAFQHLFTTTKGMPVPEWVTEDLPNLYRLLQAQKELREAIRGLIDAQKEFAKYKTIPVDAPIIYAIAKAEAALATDRKDKSEKD